MSDSFFLRIKTWIKDSMRAMGEALFAEKNKNQPPESGEQPYKDTPKKGLF